MELFKYHLSIPPACQARANGKNCEIKVFSLFPDKDTVGVILVGAPQHRGARHIVVAHIDRIDDADDLRESVETVFGSFLNSRKPWSQLLGQGVQGHLVTKAGSMALGSAVLAAFREAVGDLTRLTLRPSVTPTGVNVRTGVILEEKSLRRYKPASFDETMEPTIRRHQTGSRETLTAEGEEKFWNHLSLRGDPSTFVVTAGLLRRDPVMTVVDLCQPNWRKAYGINL